VHGNERVLDVPASDAVGTEEDERLALERRQLDDFFVRDEVEVVKDGAVLGHVLVLDLLPLLAPERAVHCQ
jgi:hypothetical protein